MNKIDSMRIAILGATSQIAKDFIASFAKMDQTKELFLFARRPNVVEDWLTTVGLSEHFSAFPYETFGQLNYEAIINFVGVGNPARTMAMGASIFDVTLHYDQLALDYLSKHPTCRYLFLSSGAAYGGLFLEPVQQTSRATVTLNDLPPQEWYGIAKLYAECRHRALVDNAIIDIRIFNYFSRTQDLAARFLLTDIVRNILNKSTLQTSPDYIVRDYLHPTDFFRLIHALLSSPPMNAAVDCYTLAPIDKPNLLKEMQREFGLCYETAEATNMTNATGIKPYYYSQNHRAADFGYIPTRTSLTGIIEEVHAIIAAANGGVL